MEISKDSIVSSFCGIKCNIKLFELCNYLETDEDVEEIIECLNEDSQYDMYGEWYINAYDEITCNVGLCFDDGVTELIEKIFEDKFLMMTTSRLFYSGYDDKSESPTYLEHCIENQSLNIDTKYVTKNHHEEETMEITDDNFLTEIEKDEWEGYRENSNVEHTYDHSFYFIKKSEFKKEKWWLGWTLQQ